MIDVVVLAAGAGRRLGTVAKATLVVDGETYLARIARLAERAGVGKPLVVVGPPHRDETVAEAERLGLATVDNPQPERGMGSSVALGFGHLSASGSRAAAALMWPVDHPFIAVETIRELAARVQPSLAIVPTHGERGGHPVLIGRELWPDMTGAGDLPLGARSVLSAASDRVRRIEVADAGVVRDVDTPQELP